MMLAHRQRQMLAIVIGALAVIAVIVAGIRGYGQGALLVVLVVALLTAYVIRHQVRARLLYKRQGDSPTTTDDSPLISRSPQQGRSWSERDST
jgi:hypothetical protein